MTAGMASAFNESKPTQPLKTLASYSLKAKIFTQNACKKRVYVIISQSPTLQCATLSL
jgi:hypothetical protein